MNNMVFQDLPLPFATRMIEVPGGFADEYIIPFEWKAEVLKKLYPFTPVPSLEDTRLDLHEEKTFTARDFRVLRDDDEDRLVSPYYPYSGGTVTDWVEPD